MENACAQSIRTDIVTDHSIAAGIGAVDIYPEIVARDDIALGRFIASNRIVFGITADEDPIPAVPGRRDSYGADANIVSGDDVVRDCRTVESGDDDCILLKTLDHQPSDGVVR